MRFHHGKVHTYELRSIGFLVRIIVEDHWVVTCNWDRTEKSRAKSRPAELIKLVETSTWEHFFNGLVPERIQIQSLRLHFPTFLILLSMRTSTTTRNSCNLSIREPKRWRRQGKLFYEYLTLFEFCDFGEIPLIYTARRAVKMGKRASDVMTRTKLRQTNRKQFLKQPVFLEHIFETKTLSRFRLVLSDRADVVWDSSGYHHLHSIFGPRELRYW